MIANVKSDWGVSVKKRSLVLLAVCMLLSACTGGDRGEASLEIAATTWPVYCLTTAVTEGVEGVQVTPVVTEQVSCLHDYTLTVNHMKLLERADVLVLNGLGLEDFMSDALGSTQARQIDCSTGIETLTQADGGVDPHIWMDPDRAARMVQTIADGLSAADPDHAGHYQDNAAQAAADLTACATQGREQLAQLDCRSLITFHDGFGYFADTFGLTILRSIEEEEGSEASARDINEVIDLIQTHQLPAIFTEVNGSQATAQAIVRETGVATAPLSMIMSGTGSGLAPYLEAMEENLNTIQTALGEAAS